MAFSITKLPNWLRITAMVLVQLWMDVCISLPFVESFSKKNICFAICGLLVGGAALIILYTRKARWHTSLMYQCGLVFFFAGALLDSYEHYGSRMFHTISFYVFAAALTASFYGIIVILVRYNKKINNEIS